MPTLQIILTDGDGVQGLAATFGAIIESNIIQTSADAAAAALSASQAAASASAAASSATNAAASATGAASSASAAAASASAASTSATNAANSATAASGSATNAANSATAASGSASAAATSATNAAASATAAATSAANAASTLANALTKANNLSDVANAAAAATNLGLGTGNTPTFTNVKLSGSTAHGVAVGQAGSGMTFVPPGSTAGLPLVTNGSAADPTYQVLPVAGGGTGANTAAGALTNLGTQPTNNPTFTGNVGVPIRSPGDSSANAAATAFVAAAIAPFSGKNRIINGACNIAQRGSLVCSTGVSGYGGPDRFYAANANSAGGQFTQSQGTITYGGITRNAVVQTVNTAVSSLTGTNFWYGITQKIEGFNCADMLGAQAALSFIFNTNVSGTYSVAIADGPASSQVYISTFAATANTPVKISIPIASLPTNLNTQFSNNMGLFVAIGALNNGTYQQSTLNSWQSGTFISASGATNWGASVNNFIAATEIQLESGSVATPFERRPFGAELALCQRYTEVLIGYVVGMGVVTSGTAAYIGIQYIQKRVVPTLTFSALSGFGLFTAPTGTLAPSSISGPLSNLNSTAILAGYSTGGLTVGQSCFLSASGGSVIVSAEL